MTVATSMAQTLQVGEISQPSDNSGDQPTPPEDLYRTGIVNGTVCYPSDFIPEMTHYLENTNTEEITLIPIPLNLPAFSNPVPPGTYLAWAWLPDYSAGGIYSEAVPCGLSVSCTDHSLIEFLVATGEGVNDIQVCDWYLSPSQIPYPPGINYSQFHGSLSDTLGYPSEFIPPMTVVATNQDTHLFYFVETNQNDSTYLIEHIPPENYQMTADPQGAEVGGGYTQFVA